MNTIPVTASLLGELGDILAITKSERALKARQAAQLGFGPTPAELHELRCRCGQPAVNLGFFCSEQDATYSTPCSCCGHPTASDTELFCSEECRDEAYLDKIMGAINEGFTVETCFQSHPIPTL